MSGKYFLFLFSIMSMVAQSLAQPWIHYYNITGLSQRWATSVVQTYDKGYLMPIIVKNGSVQEFRTIVYKLDQDGNLLWQKTIGSFPDFMMAIGICNAFDDGFLLAGRCQKYDPMAAGFVMKLNACAERQWTKEYGIFNDYDVISNIIPSPDGNYVAATHYFGYSSQDTGRVGLLKIDPVGNVIWEKDFTHGINADLLTHTVLQNGDIMISGRTFDVMGNAELIRVDSGGNELWNKYYGIPNHINNGINSIQTPDSGFLFLTFSGHTGQKRWSYLIKTDASGTQQWANFVSDTTTDQSEWPNRILKISDSTAIITMAVYQYSTIPSQTYTLKAVKIDFQGNVIDSIKFGTGNNQLFNSIVDRDMNVLVCGSHNTYQPFLIRIRPNLQVDTMLFLPAVYDSLCSYQITDGFIPYDTTTVGINENNLFNDGFFIQPNPATHQLTVQYSPVTQPGKAIVFNTLGVAVTEIILPPNSSTQKIEISSFPPGIYHLRLETEKYSGVKRFVKM